MGLGLIAASFYRLAELFLLGHASQDFANFWQKYQTHPPSDEGSGHKKKSIMILQLRGVLGQCSSPTEDLNFVGNRLITRLFVGYAKHIDVLYSLRAITLGIQNRWFFTQVPRLHCNTSKQAA